MAPIGLPLMHTKFTLNSTAVAGFFGGEEAIEAMATVHLYKGRRWLGWFNSPGSYTVAKRFGRMADSRFWHGLFPGHNDSPAVTFGLDGEKNLKYIAALSGTTMDTGHLAHLMMERGREEDATEIREGRRTQLCDVIYLAMKPIEPKAPVVLPLTTALLGLIPISISVITCAMCALIYDWFCFSMILLGIVCSGLASLVIGKGRLVIKYVKNPAPGAPPGHGILKEGNDVMVIKGEEKDVNAITKGHFDLEMTSNKEQGAEEKQSWAIGVCSLLLLVQFLVQLLLIPQGTLFGQFMFIVSLIASWGYNSHLSSLEKEKIQAKILFHALGDPEIRRFRAGTRTTMVVFACLLLFHKVDQTSPKKKEHNLRKTLHSCLPNDTHVWEQWTKQVVKQFLDIENQSFPDLEYKPDMAPPEEFSDNDKTLLKTLLGDAAAAFREYYRVREELPADSSQPTTEK